MDIKVNAKIVNPLIDQSKKTTVMRERQIDT